MPQLIIRNLEAAVVKRLRSRAAADGVSVEEAHRRVLREALLADTPPPGRDLVDYLRTMPDVEIAFPRMTDLPRKVDL